MFCLSCGPPATLKAVCDRSSCFQQQPCVSSCTFREDSAATRLVQSSGRSLRTNTGLTQPEPTMVIPTCSLNLVGKMTDIGFLSRVFSCMNLVLTCSHDEVFHDTIALVGVDSWGCAMIYPRIFFLGAD